MTSKTLIYALLAGFAGMSAGCGDTSHEPAKVKDSAKTEPTPSASVAANPPIVEFHLCVPFEPPDPAINLGELHEEFSRQGPQAAPPGLRWVPIKDLDQWREEPPGIISYPEGIRALRTTDPRKYFKVTRGLVADVHEGRPYMLVHAADDKCMTREAEKPWKIVAARGVTDYLEQPAIELTFDEPGRKLYERLYEVIEGNRYAILVDGEVISAGYMTRWFRPSPAVLVAEIPEDEIRALVDRFN